MFNISKFIKKTSATQSPGVDITSDRGKAAKRWKKNQLLQARNSASVAQKNIEIFRFGDDAKKATQSEIRKENLPSFNSKTVDYFRSENSRVSAKIDNIDNAIAREKRRGIFSNRSKMDQLFRQRRDLAARRSAILEQVQLGTMAEVKRFNRNRQSPAKIGAPSVKALDGHQSLKHEKVVADLRKKLTKSIIIEKKANKLITTEASKALPDVRKIEELRKLMNEARSKSIEFQKEIRNAERSEIERSERSSMSRRFERQSSQLSDDLQVLMSEYYRK